MRWRSAAVVLLAVALGACKWPWSHGKSCIHHRISWWKMHTLTTRLNDRLSVIRLQGGGLAVGNVTVLSGPDGVLMVDTGFAQTAGRVQSAIRQISGGALRYAIVTHWHGDHSCGAAAMHRAGAAIVAQDEARTRMAKGSAWTPSPGPDGLPQVTYQETLKLHLDGEDVELIHPHNAHTAGDTMVFFRTSNVISTGDVFVNGAYPYIPATRVSGVTGEIAAEEMLLGLIDDKTKVVPGHGPVGSRADVQASLDMLKGARERIAALKAQGLDKAAIKKLDPLKDLDAKWSRDTVFHGQDLAQWIYDDLSRTPGNDIVNDSGGG